jgi:hypothetical protein
VGGQTCMTQDSGQNAALDSAVLRDNDHSAVRIAIAEWLSLVRT